MELYGMLEANVIDSISLLKAYGDIVYGKEDLSEVEIELIVDKYKKSNRNLKDLSFKTMAAINNNGGDLHHNNTNKRMSDLQIVVIDSGSQYLFGTTDITRTIGRKVTEEMRNKYTAVLKAIIAAKLLVGDRISGADVDKAARSVVDKFKFDYASATGHGIGAGLSVHEDFPSISKSGERIVPNQVFSIEPGYYNTSKFGIRIEDDVFFDDDHRIINLTYIPYHLDLIDVRLLDENEIDYINNYHEKVRMLLKPILNHSLGLRYLNDNTRRLEKY